MMPTVELADPPRPGDLLVSSVVLNDGVFDQTVVLLLDYDDSGALGVVLNRVASIDLAEVLPQWQDLVCDPAVLFEGGPVSPNGAICLASLRSEHSDPPGWRRVYADIGLLHLDTPVELVEGALRHLRIFAGYAGWGPHQLDGELVRGMWHVVTSQYDDVFGEDPEEMWRRVLHRQGGDLALFATWTDRPEVN